MPSPFDVAPEAPFGKLGARVANGALRELVYLPKSTPTVNSSDALIARLARQLDAYYIDTRVTFDVPLAPIGIDFQLRVWQAISATPCSSVITCGTIAQQAGNVSRTIG